MRNNLFTKRIITFSVFQIVISLFFPFIMESGFSLLSIINSMFFVGMIVFLISSFLLILKVGFFDGITHSFRKFFKTFSKQGQLLGDDLDQMAIPSEYEYTFAKPLLISSLIVLVIMLIFLYIYYL